MQIYQTPIRKIPIQLNELWEHAALPTKQAHSETGKGPHNPNVNSVKKISENKDLSEDRKQQLRNQRKFQQITQLQEVSSELQKVKDNASTKAQAGSIANKPNMNFDQVFSQIRCYRCNKLGYIAKFCRSNSQTSYRGNFNPSFRGRG